MKPLIGGQAVVEGVMMKSPSHYAISVRKKDGKINTKIASLSKRRFKPLKWPIIRGFVSMIDMLILGLKSLEWSANQQEEEEEITAAEYIWLVIISLGFGIGMFIVLPLVLTRLITQSNGVVFNLIDGLLRILIFTIYLMIMGTISDVRILFQYHGAEHKTVNCYESGEGLTVENAKRFSTAHPRCGTAFVLVVLMLSIIIFSFVTSNSGFIKFLIRLIFIPIIAGVSYEILQYSAKHMENIFIRAITAPGLLVQKLTTREPNDRQLQVALESMKMVLSRLKEN
jgi:uncharacterized protein YqhQ